MIFLCVFIALVRMGQLWGARLSGSLRNEVTAAARFGALRSPFGCRSGRGKLSELAGIWPTPVNRSPSGYVSARLRGWLGQTCTVLPTATVAAASAFVHANRLARPGLIGRFALADSSPSLAQADANRRERVRWRKFAQATTEIMGPWQSRRQVQLMEFNSKSGK